MAFRRTRPPFANRFARTARFVAATLLVAPLGACIPRSSEMETERLAYRVPLSDRAWPEVAMAFHLDDATVDESVAVASIDESVAVASVDDAAFAGGD